MRKIDPRQPDMIASLALADWLAAHEPPEVSPSVVSLGLVVAHIEGSTGGHRRHGMLESDFLDAAERLLVAYHGFASAKLRDEPTFEEVVFADFGRTRRAKAGVVRTGRGLWLAGH